MSDFSIRPEHPEKDGTASSPSARNNKGEEPASKNKGEEPAGSSHRDESPTTHLAEAPGKPSSFWARAARIWRSVGSSNLREDLTDALAADESAGVGFSPEERAMLNNILRFREVRVEDVMVPRADIEAVDKDMTIGELMVLFEESGRSRMPVYAETLDDPRGMVHIRDLLAYVTKQARNKRRAGKPEPMASPVNGEKAHKLPKAAFDLERVNLDATIAEAGILRPVLFVPPSMLASDLLAKMQSHRTQMALVIDEYGGTDGLASLEDIVELVVGDIEDEHDEEEAMFTRQSEDIFIADARVELGDIAKAIGPDFDISERVEDVDTLGGLIFAALGRIPPRGEVVHVLPGFQFYVLEAEPRRIKKVRIIRERADVNKPSNSGTGKTAKSNSVADSHK